VRNERKPGEEERQRRNENRKRGLGDPFFGNIRKTLVRAEYKGGDVKGYPLRLITHVGWKKMRNKSKMNDLLARGNIGGKDP